MRLGDSPTKKSKTDKFQKYVSVFENNQFQIDWNHFVSTRLIRKANLYVIGSNWDLSLSVICVTTAKLTEEKNETENS